MDRLDKALLAVVLAGGVLLGSLAYTSGFLSVQDATARYRGDFGSPVAATPVPPTKPEPVPTIFVEELPDTGTGSVGG